MPDTRLLTAVIGAGAIALHSHLLALRQHADEVNLVAAADPDADRLEAFAQAAGGSLARYDEPLRMLIGSSTWC